ncbi:MAG: guanylate kinase [Candidatus Fonsibacter sp.]
MILILSSPSGAGKTTLAKKIIDLDPTFKLSISCTTRKPRENEVDGVDYKFLSIEEFNKFKFKDLFLEHAEVFGNYYGTLKSEIQENQKLGLNLIFDIDWQGTEQIVQSGIKDLVTVFILPPSIIELENRLKKREQNNKQEISKRMYFAKKEISHWKDYKYVLINKDLQQTVDCLITIIKLENRNNFN